MTLKRLVIATILTALFLLATGDAQAEEYQEVHFINFSKCIIQYTIAPLKEGFETVRGRLAPYRTVTYDEKGFPTPLWTERFELPTGMYEVAWRYFDGSLDEPEWLWHYKLVSSQELPTTWAIFNPYPFWDIFPHRRRNV